MPMTDDQKMRRRAAKKAERYLQYAQAGESFAAVGLRAAIAKVEEKS